LGIDDDFSEAENEHENGETIQANPETCWPTVPSVNKKNEPPPKKPNPKWKIATFICCRRSRQRTCQNGVGGHGGTILGALRSLYCHLMSEL
jgi:hypothetical protein